MKALKLLRALPALLTMSGCVAVLGVDSDEFEDLDVAVCSCFDGPQSFCQGVIQTYSKVAGFERIVSDCLETERTCRQLGECVREAGLCSAPGDECEPFDESKQTLQFRCCTGDCGEDDRCPSEDACVDLKQPCGGAEACCTGLECGSDSLCCRSLGGACVVGDGSPPCCPGQIICHENRCTECANTGQTCNDLVPCCDAEQSCTGTDAGAVCL